MSIFLRFLLNGGMIEKFLNALEKLSAVDVAALSLRVHKDVGECFIEVLLCEEVLSEAT